MKKYSIYVYAICKNEEKFVDRWMDSMSEADGIVVVDTGSSDKTVEKLRARGAAVFEETVVPWRFDTARNSALNRVPEAADICVSTDLDEVFEPGWRNKVEEAWDEDCTRAGYWILMEKGPDQTTKRFVKEKIHCRAGFKWIHPVHELLEYSGLLQEKTIFIRNIFLKHKPDLSKQRSQYLPLLELSVQEDPQAVQTRFWLGREYAFHKRYKEAIQVLTEYLEMPKADWNEERSAAMRFMGISYYGLQDEQNALSWLYRAAAECPAVREPWLELARQGYHAGNWPLTYYAARKGLNILTVGNSYLVEMSAWGYVLEDYAAIACYRLGLYDLARSHARRACDIEPGDPRLENNLNIINQKIKEIAAPEGEHPLQIKTEPDRGEAHE